MGNVLAALSRLALSLALVAIKHVKDREQDWGYSAELTGQLGGLTQQRKFTHFVRCTPQEECEGLSCNISQYGPRARLVKG